MPISSPEFDAMLRQEIARSSGRGGETDTQGARDRLAKRLNIQEGRTGGGNVSSAYRPQRGSPPASRGSKSKSSGGRKSTPQRSAPSGGLPDTGPVLPDRPDTAAPDGGGWPTWLLPLILAASRKGQGMMGGDVAPPDQSGGAVEPRRVGSQVVGPGTGSDIVDAQYEVLGQPQRLTGPGSTRALPYNPGPQSLPPTAMGGQDDISRFMAQGELPPPPAEGKFYTDEEIAAIQRGAAPLNAMESGAAGAGGGRYGPDVYRPGIDMPSPTPGLHGSRFAQPILKHIPIP